MKWTVSKCQEKGDTSEMSNRLVANVKLSNRFWKISISRELAVHPRASESPRLSSSRCFICVLVLERSESSFKRSGYRSISSHITPSIMGWQHTFTLEKRTKGCHLITDEVISHILPGLENVKVSTISNWLSIIFSIFDLIGWYVVFIHVSTNYAIACKCGEWRIVPYFTER